MQTDKTISYVLRKNIDQEKWNNCIKQAGNGLIYAYSDYLDQMAGDWDGLVYGEYEAVMPLPWRKKYGIYYLYQPFLPAQLGLFGNTIGPHLLSGFLKAIPEKFRLWEFSLNHRNVFTLP